MTLSLEDTACTPEALLAYAAQQEDQLTGAIPDDHTWLFVDQLPFDCVGGRERWAAFWAEVQAEGEARGLFFWEGLIPAVQAGQAPPIVVALVADPDAGTAWPNVWDGQHRLGATAVSEGAALPAVMGVPKNLPLAQVPEAWKALAAVRAPFHPDDAASPSPKPVRHRLR